MTMVQAGARLIPGADGASVPTPCVFKGFEAVMRPTMSRNQQLCHELDVIHGRQEPIMMTLTPMRAIATPVKSHRVGAMPSTFHSHTMATVMYTPP